MSKTTEVVAVQTHTTESGIEVEVTIARSIYRIMPMRPDVHDVPQDVRDALSKWLAEA